MRGGRVEAKSSGWNLLNKLLLPSKKGKKVAAVGTLTHNAAQARLNALNVYGPGKKKGHTRDVSNGATAQTAAATARIFGESGAQMRAAKSTARIFGEGGGITAAASGSSEAPSGWAEHTDPDSGAVFYAHATTGETVWERPAAMGRARGKAKSSRTLLQLVPESSKSKPKPKHTRKSTALGAVVGKWEAFSDDAGTTYYYNEATGATSWNLPDTESQRAVRQSVAVGGWERTLDEPSGSFFFHNTLTGETSWDQPAAFSFKTSGAGGGAAAAGDGGTTSSTAEAAPYAAMRRASRAGANRRAKSRLTSRSASFLKRGLDESTGSHVAKAHGWSTCVDPSSGKPFFHNTATGETSWERPLAMAIDSANARAKEGVAAGGAALVDANAEIARLKVQLRESVARCDALEAVQAGASGATASEAPTTASTGEAPTAAAHRLLQRKLQRSEAANARLSTELDECHDQILRDSVTRRQRRFRGSSFRGFVPGKGSGTSGGSGMRTASVPLSEGSEEEEEDWADVEELPPAPRIAKHFDRTMMMD